MQLPDVNVLIYAHREDAPEHEEYADWLKRLAAGSEPFALSELGLSAFVRIVTNKKIFRPATPLHLALSFAESLMRRHRCILVRPGRRHWGIFSLLCKKSKIVGPMVSDAYFAALAIEHGCEFITTDSDYARFEGLRWKHPLSAE